MANHVTLALEKVLLLNEREHRAIHDAVTELPNRVRLLELLTEAISQTRDDSHTAVLAFGLDDFSEINETLGHEHGDEVLVETAFRLTELSQANWTVARIGSEEFAVVVPDVLLDSAQPRVRPR